MKVRATAKKYTKILLQNLQLKEYLFKCQHFGENRQQPPLCLFFFSATNKRASNYIKTKLKSTL